MNTPRKDLILLIVSAILAGTILFRNYGTPANFADQALGQESIRYTAVLDGKPIHAVELDTALLTQMLKTPTHKGDNILILGNSQTHSVNQPKPGDVNYVQFLAGDSSRNFLAQTIPNANLQEFWVLFSFWTTKLQFREVLVPAFMDDLREDGIRTYFIEALRNERFLLSDTSALSKEINGNLTKFYDQPSTGGETAISMKKETPQDMSERVLNQYLQDHSELWRNREAARGEMFLSLYNARNTVFGINASTKRKLLPALYEKNLQALELILDDAKRKGIKALVYIPPIRNDLELPYYPEEYAGFKDDLARLCARHGAALKNYENIIPAQYWGSKVSTNLTGKSEIDFMHFQSPGHRILADSLQAFISEK